MNNYSDYFDDNYVETSIGHVTLGKWISHMENTIQNQAEEIEELKRTLNPCVAISKETVAENNRYRELLEQTGVAVSRSAAQSEIYEQLRKSVDATLEWARQYD